MKKIIIGLMLAAVVAALAGCDSDKYPYLKIVQNSQVRDDIIIPIGSGYHLMKQMYTIEEHKDGYDIIIHVKAGERE